MVSTERLLHRATPLTKARGTGFTLTTRASRRLESACDWVVGDRLPKGIPTESEAMSGKLKEIEVVAAVICSGGRYLVCQRREDASFPLKWEFAGGKVEKGEGPLAALHREL